MRVSTICTSQLGISGLSSRIGLGKSEIGEQCAVDTFFKENIGRFHIAMDQTLSMSCSHASGKLWSGTDRTSGLDPFQDARPIRKRN